MIHAASGRKSAISSGSACGRRPSSSRRGRMPSWAASVDARAAEDVGLGARARTSWRATTKAMASGPPCSWTQRQTPRVRSACSGSELPAMKPATQAMRAARARASCAQRRGRRRRASAGALRPGSSDRRRVGRRERGDRPTTAQSSAAAMRAAPATSGRSADQARAFQRRSVARVSRMPCDEARGRLTLASMRSARRAGRLSLRPSAQALGAARSCGTSHIASSGDPPRHLARARAAVAEDDRHLDDAEAGAATAR